MAGDVGTEIGAPEIKRKRRDQWYRVQGDEFCVGRCVPFNFCSRSVMLSAIHNKSGASLYVGGQENIVHLVANFTEVTKYAKKNGRKWFVTNKNAIAHDCKVSTDINTLNWKAIKQRDYWADVKSFKQAEFLIDQELPFEYVKLIGVFSKEIAEVVRSVIRREHWNKIAVKRDWYY